MQSLTLSASPEASRRRCSSARHVGGGLPVMKRNGRGRGSRERVDAARRQAALALGRDPDQRDSFVEPPKSNSPEPPTTSASRGSWVQSPGIRVLSIGEAADCGSGCRGFESR
jgi:hypothetical protein